MQNSTLPSFSPGGTATEWSGSAHLQTKWDWRAVGNFIGGGSGAGLLLSSVLTASSPLSYRVQAGLGLAVIALGLLCIMAKMGRPSRAFNIFRHVETSWMTREGFAMPTLFGCGLLALWQGNVGLMAWLATASALFFLYCQAKILREARGIPAWSAPAIIPLLLAGGMAEGFGLAVLASLTLGGVSRLQVALLLVALCLRYWAWRRYQTSLVARSAPREALGVVDGFDGGFAVSGHGLPLVLAAVALWLDEPALTGLAATAGLIATASGWYMKFVLVTRAGFFYRKRLSLAYQGRPPAQRETVEV